MADSLVPPALQAGWTMEKLRHYAELYGRGPIRTALTYYADALDAQAPVAQPDAPSPAQLRAMWDYVVATARLFHGPATAAQEANDAAMKAFKVLLRAAGEGA